MSRKPPRVHPLTLLVGFLLAAVAVFCLGLAFAGADAAAKGGLPPSPEREYPAECDVPYTLQPGERAVLLCVATMPRGGLEGIAQIASGHEAVDAAIIHRAGLGHVVFSVTNHSTEPVSATARGEQW